MYTSYLGKGGSGLYDMIQSSSDFYVDWSVSPEDVEGGGIYLYIYIFFYVYIFLCLFMYIYIDIYVYIYMYIYI
jgi:hypothetical protein